MRTTTFGLARALALLLLLCLLLLRSPLASPRTPALANIPLVAAARIRRRHVRVAIIDVADSVQREHVARRRGWTSIYYSPLDITAENVIGAGRVEFGRRRGSSFRYVVEIFARLDAARALLARYGISTLRD